MNLTFQPPLPYVPCYHVKQEHELNPIHTLYYARYPDGRCELPSGTPGDAWREINRDVTEEYPTAGWKPDERFTWVPYKATCRHCEEVVWEREEPWS